MSDANKRIARCFFEEVCNGGDLSLAHELFAPNFGAQPAAAHKLIDPVKAARNGCLRELVLLTGPAPRVQ